MDPATTTLFGNRSDRPIGTHARFAPVSSRLGAQQQLRGMIVLAGG